MTVLNIVGLAGSYHVPSRTRRLVEEIVNHTITRYAEPPAGRRSVTSKVVDLTQFGPDLALARRIEDLAGTSRDIVDLIIGADVLVVAVPVYKGSYPGLFKHLFDLIDPQALAGKPVILAATGGGDKHALIVEHQLRPLFAFFESQTMATGIYASDKDFEDGRLVSASVFERIGRAIDQLEAHVGRFNGKTLQRQNVTPLRLFEATSVASL